MDTCKSNLIELSSVTKKYGSKVVLDNLNLTISPGDFVSVVGPSGCGKSTLVNILGLLDRRFEGSYLLGDMVVNKASESALSKIRNLRIGFVFQAYHLIDYMTVEDNILMPVSYFKKSVEKERYEFLMDMLGLNNLRKQVAVSLSGGEKQRVSIARAMINNPELIIADEPTGNLDGANTGTVFSALKKMNEAGTTIVMVTHNDELAAKTTRQLVLNNGKLVEG